MAEISSRGTPFLYLLLALPLVVAVCLPTAGGGAAQTGMATGVTPDIAYAEGGGADQQLDLYVPEIKSFPTIVFVHGGGLTDDWPAGREGAPYPGVAKAFQSAGVAVAVIGYRLGPGNAWPAQPLDVAGAFAWVKRNIGSRGGDPRRVFLMGHSSGGHLVGVVGDDAKYVGRYGFALRDIAGVIPMGSLLDFQRMLDQYTPAFRDRIFRTNGFFQTFRTPEVMADAGPTQHIGRGMPPYLIVMGDNEQENPPILADSKDFVAKAMQAGGHASYVVIPNRRHLQVLQEMANPDDPAMQAILKFIQ